MNDTAPLSALLLTVLGVTSLRTAMREVRTCRQDHPQERRSDVVVSAVEMTLVDPRDGESLVDADLVFDPRDPFAVTTVFRACARTVRWTFGRELLAQGLYAPVGDGDVHVWPCLSSSGSAVVVVELGSPEGEVMLQAESRAVSRFVEQMLAAVPDGEETAYVDLDGELARILTD